MKKEVLIFFLTHAVFILNAQVICNNIPPVAIAGKDTIIHNNQTSCITPLPITITVNGSSSFDPDGILVSYLWSGVNGITSPNVAITTVTGLLPGTYTFILKVADNNGAFAYDTIHISIIPGNRPLIPARLIPIGTLSQARGSVTAAAAGNKILFAGGGVPPGYCATSRVDIYNISTNSWTTAELSEARYGIGVAVLGNRIFFGGGFSPKIFPNTTPPWCYIGNIWYPDTRSSAIDIYDASSNTWSTSQLSTRRTPQGASAGNKVLFAGGDEWYSIAIPSNVIDNYDGNTNSWTPGSLSETKGLPQIATSGNKVFLAGGAAQIDGDYFFGITKRIDIYDAASGQWSVDSLSIERASMGSISANNKIYWGGGVVANPDPDILYVATSLVEIRDLATNTSTFDCLSEPIDQLTAIRKDNKIIFFGKYNVTKFDIYDLTSNSWSIGVLPQNFTSPVFVSYNNSIYVTEGSQVWKLEIDNCTNNSSSAITATACDRYTLNGKTYLGSGIYTQKLINAVGCDSVITLYLTVNYSTHCTTTAKACDIFTWQGKTYTASGFYSDTLVSSNGCDSILSLFLTINNKTLTTVNAAICSGQIYEGHTTTGTYIDTLIASNDCDSIHTLNLIVKPKSFSTVDTSICAGQNYAGYTRSGTYTDFFTATNGCDSVRTLNLTVKNNCNIYIPNAFTPNNDGLNDMFKPTINLALQKFSFIIFNRYGEKIFETYEYGKGWDGTYKGKDQATGSYVYRITFTNISGYVSDNNGTVLLIR